MMPLVVDTFWGSLFQVSKPAFQGQSLKVNVAVGQTLRALSSQ